MKTNLSFGTKEKVIIIFIICAVGLILLTQFYALPAIAKMKKLSKAIPAREADLIKLVKIRDDYFDIKDKMAWINTALQKRGPHFELLTFLEELAKKCQIDNKIVAMRPMNHPSSLPNEITVEIDIDNLATEELTNYLFEIEHSGKLLYLKKTNIRSTFGREKYIRVSLQVSTLTEKL